MSPCASLPSNSKLSRSQTDIVINDNQILRRCFIIIQHHPQALPAEIHKRLRFYQKNLLTFHHASAAKGSMLPFTDVNLIPLCQLIDHLKSYIVSCFIIFFCGIPKPCNNIHDSSFLLFRLLFSRSPAKSAAIHLPCAVIQIVLTAIHQRAKSVNSQFLYRNEN